MNNSLNAHSALRKEMNNHFPLALCLLGARAQRMEMLEASIKLQEQKLQELLEKIEPNDIIQRLKALEITIQLQAQKIEELERFIEAAKMEQTAPWVVIDSNES